MLASDRYGSPFLSSSGGARLAWDAAMHGILVHGPRVAADLAAAETADPHSALVAATRGLCLLLAGRAELVAPAREAADRADAALRLAPDPRGACYLAALRDWLAGSPSRCVRRFDAWHQAEPSDALAVKLAHQIRFMAGDVVGMHRAATQALARLPADHGARGYLLGCAAFATEELGAMRDAERLAREAVATNADDVWAIHAVAHAMEMTGRASAGARWIEEQRPAWQACGNLRFHLSWHFALFEMELGRRDRALELYDTEIRAERTDDYRDIANAVSLLARLELEGVAVGARWEELADRAAARIADDAVVFARLHYVLALLRARRTAEAAALIDSMRQSAASLEREMDRVARHPGLAVARALEAFEFGRYGEAAALLEAADGRLGALGGSIAQRDLFQRHAVEAALRAGRADLAAELIERRRAARGGVIDAFAAARLRAGPGHGQAAAAVPVDGTPKRGTDRVPRDM